MMKKGENRVKLECMDIIKNLSDFIETGEQVYTAEFMKNKLRTDVCEVKIKNKKFMLKYLEPSNDFIIHTTSIPCSDPSRLLA